MMQGRRLILPVAALTLSVMPLASGCASQNPAENEEAAETRIKLLLGFDESVDEELLQRLEIHVFQVFESPLAAYARIDISADSDPEAVLAMIEAEPTVSFVQRAVLATVTFHDRTTGDEPISAADSTAVRNVGGRIRAAMDITAQVIVVLPEGTVDALRADPAVESLAPSIVGHAPPP